MSETLTPNEMANLETLPIVIPDYERESSPFSSGRAIEKYKQDDLKKRPSGEKTSRTDWFEKRLVGIWLKIGRPVPYAFRTDDGNPRSLDAGCLGYLLNRETPELETTCDSEGYIIEVEPAGDLRHRYTAMEERLVDDIRPTADGIGTNQDAPVDSQELTSTEPPQSTDDGFDSPLIDFNIDAPVDERRKQESGRAVRDGAERFRRDLLKTWGGQCAIAGTHVAEALDGAHIYPYLGDNTNLVINGVLLRADLHRLFDRHLISFRYEESSLIISVSKKLADTEYEVYSGRRIVLPTARRHQPAECFIRWHYEKFKSKEN
jgi:hypothetical protein